MDAAIKGAHLCSEEIHVSISLRRWIVLILTAALALAGFVLFHARHAAPRETTWGAVGLGGLRDAANAKLAAAAVAPPDKATRLRGSGCSYYHAVQCWAVDAPFDEVKSALVTNLGVATGTAPAEICSVPRVDGIPGGCRLGAPVGTSRVEVLMRRPFPPYLSEYDPQLYVVVRWDPDVP